MTAREEFSVTPQLSLGEASHKFKLVVGVFNMDPENEATIQVDWDLFEACCEQGVFDVWRQKDLGVYKGGLSVRLSPHGVGLFRLTP